MLIKKKWVALGALLAASSGVANASYITTFTEGMYSQEGGATHFDFNDGKPANYSGQGSVLSGSVPGMSASPAGDSSPYLSVAYPESHGYETFTAPAGTKYNYFGLYWGSIDNYNSMHFVDGDTIIANIYGIDVIEQLSLFGNQTSPGSNRYVNFTFGDQTFDRIVFKTSDYAFESDNHAVANVPEPGTLALMGAAFAGLALRRRRAKSAVEASA